MTLFPFELPEWVAVFGFLIPLLAAAGKTVLGTVLGGLGTRLLGGVTNPNVMEQGMSAIIPYPGSGGSMVPMTRSEIERRQAANRLYSTRQPLSDIESRARGVFGFDGGGGYRRRMNVLNPRALNRSIRRVKGFAKFAKRVGSFTDPGKSYRLKGFGRKRRRR